MKRRAQRVLIGFATLVGLFLLFFIFSALPAQATINQQINFQGKLTNPDGTNLSDGSYSIRFRIYTDPSADGANPCAANSCKWEETKNVVLDDGIFNTALGDTTALPGGVDFNGATLYLGIKVTTDLEMTPRLRLTAAPYAFNSENLGGLNKDGFVQLAQGVQTDGSTTNPSIFINKTGATANILQLQRGGTDVAVIANDGSTLVRTTTNSTSAFQIQNSINSQALVVDTTPLNTLITNSSVEGTSITNWAVKAGSATLTRDTTQSFVGNASLKALFTSTAVNDGVKYTPSPVLAATPYVVSFSIKQTAGTAFGTNLAVGWNNGSDTNCTLSPTLTEQPVPTTGWARYQCTFTGTTGAADHLYWKQTDAPASARTYFIDAVQVETGSTTTAFKETGITLNGVINSSIAVKNTSDSTSEMVVQNASGGNLFVIDSVNSFVRIGSATADATAVLLVLDTKNTSGDPTGANGGLYYNSNTNKFRCFQGSIWRDCINLPDSAFFEDTTPVAFADIQTTELFNDATKPNIVTDSATSNVMVTLQYSGVSNTNNDAFMAARIVFSTDGIDPSCTTSPQVGRSLIGGFTTATTHPYGADGTFIHTPGVAGTIKYTVCSSNDAVGTVTDTADNLTIALVELGD